ncbi:hypothetical protein [Streptomyces rubradiris]|uniref:Uncharacterized protein n=1 Tax=Streptomyces rubradiris TaxID=285531 RepID=A0ABQ3RAF7_STRRR|nr:hypothetical protein [Streptomyces rubradiris]GHH31457.1 hypothetical protein GCM10018792_79230 [Streptomyces rubradiris]GHI52841.1 hypothetical protein Srubr_26870 [Streptomyces rubradiris]
MTGVLDDGPVFLDDTPPIPANCAELARPAWELYQKTPGTGATRIAELITDLLHLADKMGQPGGAERTIQEAVAEYRNERVGYLEYMVEQVVRGGSAAAPKSPRYLGQFRPAGRDWITIVEGDETAEPIDVAGCLRAQMQRADLRTGEIQSLVEGIARGEVITADNGTAFRVIEHPTCQG